MMPTLVRATGGRQIVKLFPLLGVRPVGAFKPIRPGATRGRTMGSWWKRHEADLDGLLADLYDAYRRQIQRVHPDAGGRHEDAVAVNMAWRTVKRRFAQRGITL